MTPTGGQRLKERQRGLTLEEVARQTNIPLGHLRALEGDDLEALGARLRRGLPSRTRGFAWFTTAVAARRCPRWAKLRHERSRFFDVLLVLAASAVAFQSLLTDPRPPRTVPRKRVSCPCVPVTKAGCWVDGQLVIDESYAKPTSDNAQPREGDASVPGH